MSPEEDYHNKQAKMEAEKLENKVHALSEEEKTQIFEKGEHAFSCFYLGNCLKTQPVF